VCGAAGDVVGDFVRCHCLWRYGGDQWWVWLCGRR
jgi:hypothetical protein